MATDATKYTNRDVAVMDFCFNTPMAPRREVKLPYRANVFSKAAGH